MENMQQNAHIWILDLQVATTWRDATVHSRWHGQIHQGSVTTECLTDSSC